MLVITIVTTSMLMITIVTTLIDNDNINHNAKSGAEHDDWLPLRRIMRILR